jgi:hypothetical protein
MHISQEKIEAAANLENELANADRDLLVAQVKYLQGRVALLRAAADSLEEELVRLRPQSDTEHGEGIDLPDPPAAPLHVITDLGDGTA